MGNHERLMIDALSPDGNVNNWLMNGGQWFFMLDTDQGNISLGAGGAGKASALYH